MSTRKRAGRIGSFLAVNTGTVEGCVANVRLKVDSAASGFVYENAGTVRQSLSLKCVRNKNSRGFWYINSGTVDRCGYIAGSKTKKSDGEGNTVYKYGNPECYIRDGMSEAKIFRKLELDKVWKRSEKSNCPLLEPERKANRTVIFDPDSDVVDIKTADDLKRIISAVNSGDRAAARCNYRLTANINLKGAKIDPLGASESTPFMGKFDGNGKTVRDFRIDCSGIESGGFFGVTVNATVANLTVDYILDGGKGIVTGGLVGTATGGSFDNCHVLLSMTAGHCAGGFAGKSSAEIRNCYVCGTITLPAAILPWILAGIALLLILLSLATVILVRKLRKDPFTPEVIDPNQTPVTAPTEKNDTPPKGTNRISLELNHIIYIKASTMVGQMDYVNPSRSTQDVVIRLCVSDAELTEAGYDLVADGIRTKKEINAPGYSAENSFTELYRSGRIQIGYKLTWCKLSPLPNGEDLKVGKYNMVMMIDAYDPVTNEKSLVNARALTTVQILDQ